MRKRCVLVLIALSLTLLFASGPARADTYTFSLIPASGDVSGLAGSTVGWGYSITNESTTDWLVTTGLSSDPFLNGIPNLIFDFPDLGPGVTLTVPFSLAPTGLYELTWDATAPMGFVNFGTFTLSAEWWTGDPLNGGAPIMAAADALAPYSATVAMIPEPATVLLLLGGLGGVAFRARRRMSS